MATLITKNSSTASSVPTAAQLVQGELAVNVTDKRLFTENSSGTVVELGTNPSTLALPNGTANGVAYLNGSKVLTTGSALTFDGTTLKAAQGSSGATAVSNGNTLVLENGSAVGMSLLTPDANASRIYFGTASNNRNAFIYSDYNSGAQTLIFGLGSGATAASEQARLTSTGLGIGTSSPNYSLTSYKGGAVANYLQVASGATGAGSGNGLLLGVDASGNSVINAQGGGINLYTYVAGLLRTTIDSSGNLGIGTSSPVSALGFGETPSSTGITFQSTNTTFNSGKAAVIKASITGSGNGSMVFETYAGGSGGGERMRLDSSGNLGIGTTTIGSRVTIGDPGTGLSFTNAASGNFNIGLLAGTGSQLAYIFQRANSDLIFGTNNTERARITSGGVLLVGTTSAPSIAGVTTDHAFVAGTGNRWVSGFRNTTTGTPWGLAVEYSGAAPNDISSNFLYCYDSAPALRMSVRSNGGIANYQANDVNLSDRREKTNFAPAKSYLETICAIPVQTFNYIDQNLEEDPGLTLGVVAQDVQAVAPELVMESNWGTEDNPKMRLSIYQTDLQYALMKALQELKAEFDAYKATHP